MTRVVETNVSFPITGRGTVYETIMPDPPFEVNEKVIINGTEFIIKGIERFAVAWGLNPGMPVGLLVDG